MLPIRGYLEPGEEETVEISYFARAHSKSAVVAVCEVEGGPAYDVELTAEAHAIKYSLESTVIDVGRQPFDRVVERQLALRNEGKVKFPFRVNLSGLTRASIASVDPVEGVIPGESEVTFRFKVKIGIPDAVDERASRSTRRISIPSPSRSSVRACTRSSRSASPGSRTTNTPRSSNRARLCSSNAAPTRTSPSVSGVLGGVPG